MRLIARWHRVARYAWSIRLIVLAGLFSAIEIGLPLINGALPIPANLFALLSMIATVGAVVSRFVAQKTLMEGDGDD